MRTPLSLAAVAALLAPAQGRDQPHTALHQQSIGQQEAALQEEEKAFLKPFVELNNQAKLFEQIQRQDAEAVAKAAPAEAAQAEAFIAKPAFAGNKRSQEFLSKNSTGNSKASAIQKQVIEKIKNQQVEQIQSAVQEPKQKPVNQIMKEVLANKFKQADAKKSELQKQSKVDPGLVSKLEKQREQAHAKKVQAQGGQENLLAASQQLLKDATDLHKRTTPGEMDDAMKERLAAKIEAKLNATDKAAAAQQPVTASNKTAAASVKTTPTNATQSISQAAPPQQDSKEAEEREVAQRLLATMKMVEQQDQKAKQEAEEKRMFGHELFEHSQNLLNKATAITEEAGLKIASSALKAEEEATKTKAIQGMVPKEVLSTQALTSVNKHKDEQPKPSSTQEEVSSLIEKALSSKNTPPPKEKAKPEQVKMSLATVGISSDPSVNQRSAQFLSSLNQIRAEPQYTLGSFGTQFMADEDKDAATLSAPALHFTASGNLMQSPFSAGSLDSDLQSTHNEIISMQDKIFEMRRNRIAKVKFQPHELTDTDLIGLPTEEQPAHFSYIQSSITDRFVPGVTFLEQSEQEIIDDSSLLQLTAWKDRHHLAKSKSHKKHHDEPPKEKSNEEKIHVIFRRNTPYLVKDEPQLPGESPAFDHPQAFTILTLDTAGSGFLKTKSYKRKHLSEIYELFNDVAKIRKPDSHAILVGNQKLVRHTGSLEDPAIQALIGKAIQRKMLPFKFHHPESLANKKHPSTLTFTLYGDGRVETKENPANSLMELGALRKPKNLNINSCPKVTMAQAEITSDGKVPVACTSLKNQVFEWQSLLLVGKFALESEGNKAREAYTQDHPDEASLGLAVLAKK